MSINKISSINIFLLINITISAVMMMTADGGSHQAYYVTSPRKTTTQQQQAAYPVIPWTARTIGNEYPLWPPKITTTMTTTTEFPYPIGPKTTYQPNGASDSGYNPGPTSYPLSPCPPPPRPCIPPEGIYTANTEPGCCWQQETTPKTKTTTKTPVYYPVHPPITPYYSSTETSTPDSSNGALISKMLLARGGTPLWGKLIGIFTTIFTVILFVQIL